MKDKLGSKSAFPFNEEITDNYGGKYWNSNPGISQRLYIAAMAIQGILAAGVMVKGQTNINAKLIIPIAYEFADELLKQENEK